MHCNWSADYDDSFTFLASRYTSAFRLRYYGNHEIVMLRVYLIIHVYILERLPEHYIFRVNLGLVINIFTVLGLIFVSRLSFERGDNFLS